MTKKCYLGNIHGGAGNGKGALMSQGLYVSSENGTAPMFCNTTRIKATEQEVEILLAVPKTIKKILNQGRLNFKCIK